MNPLTVGFLLVVASGAPAAESGPMSLSLRQPVYRHSLYATQAVIRMPSWRPVSATG